MVNIDLNCINADNTWKKIDIILLVTSQLFETQLRPSQALSPLL